MYGNGKSIHIWGNSFCGKTVLSSKLVYRLVAPNATFTTVEIDQVKFTVTPTVNGKYVAILDDFHFYLKKYDDVYNNIKMLAEELPLEQCLCIGVSECKRLPFDDIYHVRCYDPAYEYAHYNASSAAAERTYIRFTENDPL